ncbi:MAG: PIN domain-containing protein [Ignavibacteriae bacterium]|nr:PIN domain-containing protein [Ignavibacteriota bacterium]
MNMRFYLDTSVFGGFFDEEFAADTQRLFAEIVNGRFSIVVSEVTMQELLEAPEDVQNLLARVPAANLDIVTPSAEALTLAERYVQEGALAEKFISDAQHIAVATIERVDSLVSWNFKHMVNFFRIRQYNAINLKNGYSLIDIRSPREVVYED